MYYYLAQVFNYFCCAPVFREPRHQSKSGRTLSPLPKSQLGHSMYVQYGWIEFVYASDLPGTSGLCVWTMCGRYMGYMGLMQVDRGCCDGPQVKDYQGSGLFLWWLEILRCFLYPLPVTGAVTPLFCRSYALVGYWFHPNFILRWKMEDGRKRYPVCMYDFCRKRVRALDPQLNPIALASQWHRCPPDGPHMITRQYYRCRRTRSALQLISGIYERLRTPQNVPAAIVLNRSSLLPLPLDIPSIYSVWFQASDYLFAFSYHYLPQKKAPSGVLLFSPQFCPPFAFSSLISWSLS